MPLQFAVLWYGGRWTLLAPSARYDRYRTRQSALDAAHRLADQARRQGHEVRVLIQDVGGELSEHLGGPPAALLATDQPASNSPA